MRRCVSFLEKRAQSLTNLTKVSARPTLVPSITRCDGAGRPAQRAAAPIVFCMVKTGHALAYARPARVPHPLTECTGAVIGVRAVAVCCGQPLRSATPPRIGELRIIADYHAERPGAPAAAADQRAALYNADLSVHPGGGLRLMALCGRCGSGLLAFSSAWALGPDGPSVGGGHGTRDTALGPHGGDI